jgi:polyisoprenoid-binding protein YceI/mono/diheme cytochrome c family protein
MKNLLKISMLCLVAMATGRAAAQGACSVAYTTVNNWGSGAQLNVTLTNTSAAKTSWELCWTYAGNDVITNLWDGVKTQTGKNVCVKNAAHNGNLPTNGTASFGFLVNNPGPAPTAYTLNGVACGGTPASSAPSSVTSSTPRSSVASSAVSSTPNTAARWLLDSTASNFYFVTVKKNTTGVETGESQTFTELQGAVAANGQATLTIPLASVSTGVDLRNTRLQTMLFESNYLPSLHFTTQLDLAAIDAMAAGSMTTVAVTGNLVLHGVVKAITFDAMIFKHATNSVSFSTRRPILINSTDFEMNAGVEALRAVMGLTAIGEKVPVYFKMFLTSDNPTNLPAITLPAAPNAPVSLIGSVSNATGDATLNWSDVSANETGFLVRRKGADGRWVTEGNALANTSTFVDSLLGAPGFHDYKVISYINSVPSLPTAPVTLEYDDGRSSVASVASSAASSIASSTVSVASSRASSSAVPLNGQQIFANQCLSCHALTSNFPAQRNHALLSAYIDANMPLGNTASCDVNCANAVSTYLLSRFTTSSSSVASSVRSSVASSVSSVTFTGDAAIGEQVFMGSGGCTSCHKDTDGDGRFTDGSVHFNVNEFTYQSMSKYAGQGYTGTTVEDLSRFVGAAMLNNCTSNNCQHIAAYLWAQKGKDPTEIVKCTSTDPVFYGVRNVKLLTSYEYNNSLKMLFNRALPADYSSPNLSNFDKMVAGLPNHTTEPVSETRLLTYKKNAEALAEWAITNNAVTSLNCGDAQSTTCASSFLDNFANLAFRRPLTAEERTEYTAILRSGANGVRWAVQGVLMSPQFLYHTELGVPVGTARTLTWGRGTAFSQADSTAYALDPYEYAAVLSYMYTASAPDRTLLTAAANGDLEDPVKLATQIDRLLDSTLGRENVARFAGLWLHTDAVTAVTRMNNANFTQGVKDSMAQEVREIYKYVFYNNLPVTDMYTGDFTMLNSTLSSYYGITGGGTNATDFRMVNTAASKRGGVLASGAYMALNAHAGRTSPIKRGVHFRQDMLCQNIPLPSSFEDTTGEREKAAARVQVLLDAGSLNTVDFYDKQTNIPGTACAQCHNAIINPLFAMDDFDHVGLLRQVVNGKVVQKALNSLGDEVGANTVEVGMVNNGGSLFGADGVGTVSFNAVNFEKDSGAPGLPFIGAKALGKTIVANNLPGVDACLINKSYRYATGYSLSRVFQDETREKALNALQENHFACVNDQLKTKLSASNRNPRAMLKEIGMSRVTRFRR